MSVREKKIRASHEHAYTLEEVADMLDKLPEPARTVCAVAAFTRSDAERVARLEVGRLRRRDDFSATKNMG